MKCPECGSKKIRKDPETKEYICQKCGFVVAESDIEMGREWRTFDSPTESVRARTGAPTRYAKLNKGMGTMIGRTGKDLKGNKLSPESRAQMYRLVKWQRRSGVSSSMQRNLSVALTELRRIASYLMIPENIVEEAAFIYRKAVEKGLIRGRRIEAVVAAVLYAVCRKHNTPRTLGEFSEATNMTKKEVGRTYRFMVRELNLAVPLNNPMHYVSRFASELGLSGSVQEKSREILKKAMKKGLVSGRGPQGLAAAAVYLGALIEGQKRTQKEVAQVAGVTEVTIRNRCREIKEILKDEINFDEIE